MKIFVSMRDGAYRINCHMVVAVYSVRPINLDGACATRCVTGEATLFYSVQNAVRGLDPRLGNGCAVV